MALSVTMTTLGTTRIETSFGSISRNDETVVITAVARIVNIDGNKEHVIAKVEFVNSDMQFVRQFVVPVSVADDAPNFIRQAYLHLKTLPEFLNATDC